MKSTFRKILGLAVITAGIAYLFRDKIKETAQPIIGAEPQPDDKSGDSYEYPWNKGEPYEHPWNKED